MARRLVAKATRPPFGTAGPPDALSGRWGRWRGVRLRRDAANLACGRRVSTIMDANLLDTKFAKIGARLKVAARPARRVPLQGLVSLDVLSDREGEFFEIFEQPGADVDVHVLDVQPQ